MLIRSFLFTSLWKAKQEWRARPEIHHKPASFAEKNIKPKKTKLTVFVGTAAQLKPVNKSNTSISTIQVNHTTNDATEPKQKSGVRVFFYTLAQERLPFFSLLDSLMCSIPKTCFTRICAVHALVIVP